MIREDSEWSGCVDTVLVLPVSIARDSGFSVTITKDGRSLACGQQSSGASTNSIVRVYERLSMFLLRRTYLRCPLHVHRSPVSLLHPVFLEPSLAPSEY